MFLKFVGELFAKLNTRPFHMKLFISQSGAFAPQSIPHRGEGIISPCQPTLETFLTTHLAQSLELQLFHDRMSVF